MYRLLVMILESWILVKLHHVKHTVALVVLSPNTPLTINPIYHFAMSAFGLFLGEPQLFKIDIGRVEQGAGVASKWSLLLPEFAEVLSPNTLAVWRLELRSQIPTKL